MEQVVSSSETATRSVKRATDLLRLLAQVGEGRSLTDLAREAALSKATAYRILQTLAGEGFVDFDEGTALYTIGTELVRITMAARKSSRLMAIRTFERLSTPVMQALRTATGETVALVIRQGDRRTNIAVELGTHELIAVPKVGAQHPLHLGGPGKLILSTLSRGEIEAYSRRAAQASNASHRFAMSSPVEAELQDIRTSGYARSFGEAVEGQCSIAAPIFQSGIFTAVLNLIVPTVRFNDEKQADFLPRVRKAADDISKLVEGTFSPDALDWE